MRLSFSMSIFERVELYANKLVADAYREQHVEIVIKAFAVEGIPALGFGVKDNGGRKQETVPLLLGASQDSEIRGRFPNTCTERVTAHLRYLFKSHMQSVSLLLTCIESHRGSRVDIG